LRDWQLAACFTQLRDALDKRHGKAAQRQFARVLQLLGEHPMQRVQAVIEACLAKGEIDAERIIAQVRHRATLNTNAPPLEAIPLCQYQVPRPELSRFDLLLSHGDSEDAR
jgi:hypothetical protein